jgi:HEAT repeat protein
MITILLGFIGLCWALFFFADSDLESDKEDAAKTSNSPSQIHTPDLQQLATAAMQQTVPFTPEELEEERQLEQKQVSHAGELLQNPDTENRVAGAEQLAAYPTEAAETHLTTALATDIDASVRATAAQSLGAFKTPKDASIDALLSGLLDPDKKVRHNALDTLQRYANYDTQSMLARRIFSKLGELLKTAKLQPDTSRDIRNYLVDHAASIKQMAQ